MPQFLFENKPISLCCGSQLTDIFKALCAAQMKDFSKSKSYYMRSSCLEQAFKRNHVKSRKKSGSADAAISCFTSECGQRVSFYVVYFKQTTLGISRGNGMHKPKPLHGYFWFISAWISNSSCGGNVEHIYTHPPHIRSLSHKESNPFSCSVCLLVRPRVTKQPQSRNTLSPNPVEN